MKLSIIFKKLKGLSKLSFTKLISTYQEYNNYNKSLIALEWVSMKYKIIGINTNT